MGAYAPLLIFMIAAAAEGGGEPGSTLLTFARHLQVSTNHAAAFQLQFRCGDVAVHAASGVEDQESCNC